MRLFPEEEPGALTSRRVFTVGEVTRDLKALVEDNFPSLWLRGEISNFKAYGSGHHYFTLKDESAQISAVMFKGSNRFLKFRPEDGLGVIVHGRLSVYELRGNYQIIVDGMEPDGVGALQLAFEQLKKRLAAEGLFEAARKRPLPYLPRAVGIVTSPHGAAVHDMLSVLRRRHPNIDIVIHPVKVQGDGAAEEIASALDYFSGTGCVDVVIVGRGGGSIEDLWAFNEEDVARAVARCAVPVVSAVGHETDFTICDFVADVRAPTPSAAAEICVPNVADLRGSLASRRERLINAMRGEIAVFFERVGHLKKRVPSPTVLHDRWRMRLGDLEDRLHQSALLRLRRGRQEVAELRLALADPSARLLQERQNLARLVAEARHTLEKRLMTRRHDAEQSRLKLELLSPLHVLRRGYAMVRRPNGTVVTRKGQAAEGDKFMLTFYDGEVRAVVEKS